MSSATSQEQVLMRRVASRLTSCKWLAVEMRIMIEKRVVWSCLPRSLQLSLPVTLRSRHEGVLYVVFWPAFATAFAFTSNFAVVILDTLSRPQHLRSIFSSSNLSVAYSSQPNSSSPAAYTSLRLTFAMASSPMRSIYSSMLDDDPTTRLGGLADDGHKPLLDKSPLQISLTRNDLGADHDY